MATQVQFRRGTTSQNNAFTGAIGEITYDTEVKTLRLHDGSTAGGGATVATLSGTQTFTNKTHSSNSVWNGGVIGLVYGGTGSSLTATAGALVYSGASTLALSAAGTAGQLLQSAGSNAPSWVNASTITAGSATQATLATNIAGGSAGQIVIQLATNQTTFVTAGAAGTFLQSTGASTPPTFAAGNITIGSTTVSFGATSTSLAGLTSIDATSGATSFFATPTAPVAFAGATTLTIGYGSTASSTTNISTGAVGSGNTKTINIGTGSAAGSTTNINLGDADGGTVTVNKDLVVSGDLTVNGTTTTINSTTLSVDDLNIVLADGAANAAAANGAGLTVAGASATILYTSATDSWQLNKHLTTSLTTQNVFNTTATTVNAFGAATSLSIGAATGTLTLNNSTITATNSNARFNSLGVGTAGSATTGQIRATDTITAYYSDERLKTDITEISGALDKVMQLRGVTFRANELAESFGYTNIKEQVGVIAQDVEKVLPQIVVPAPFDIMQLQEGIEISRSGENYKTVHYDKLVPLLIQAIKEQQVMIEELQKKVGI
jgi:cell wall assembly regulator SMI1